MPNGKIVGAAAVAAVASACLALAANPSASTLEAAARVPTAQQLQARYALEEANKKLAMAFFAKDATPESRVALMHPDYTQHNPIFKRFGEVNHVQGRAEFAAVMRLFQTDEGKAMRPSPPVGSPPPPAGEPFYAVMADGDLVTVLQLQYAPDPLSPGDYYQKFWFDTWRVKDGKLFEHWDAATIPDPAPNFLKTPLPK